MKETTNLVLYRLISAITHEQLYKGTVWTSLVIINDYIETENIYNNIPLLDVDYDSNMIWKI